MTTKYFTLMRRMVWPCAAVVAVLVIAAFELRYQGRLWLCSCGRLLPWSSNAWSSDNSQHLSDPYSFTHILHGFIFCWLLSWVAPKLPVIWRLCIAISAEASWEVIENTNFVIERYRATTAALGYVGDAVVNSLGDILFCGVGFLLAQRLGFRRSLAVFFLIEAVLLILIRDSLLLNVLMLIYPLDPIKAWQSGH
jgi:hypothetical protein